MTPVLHIERDDTIEAPEDDSFKRWVNATCSAIDADANARPELSIRIRYRRNDAIEPAFS